MVLETAENETEEGIADKFSFNGKVKELHESLFWDEDDPKFSLINKERGHTQHNLQTIDMQHDAYIWAFVGPRGAGKSMGMTFYTCKAAYLYNCRIVSNYPIAFYINHIDGRKTYHEAEPLDLYKLLCFDEDYRNCLILIDEAPDIISHMAAMTWKNRLLNIFVRQLRKNMNSLFIGAQQFTLIDKSMRWQTDVIVRCQDAFRLYGGSQGLDRGACILLDLYDNSGQWTGHGKFINHDGELSMMRSDESLELGAMPLWGVYDTYYQQDIFESLRRVDMDLGSYKVGDNTENRENESRQLLTDSLPLMVECANDGKKISSTTIYKKMAEFLGRDLLKREKDILGNAMTDCGAAKSSNGMFRNFKGFDLEKFIAMVEG